MSASSPQDQLYRELMLLYLEDLDAASMAEITGLPLILQAAPLPDSTAALEQRLAARLAGARK